jgi:nicotinamidase-related amidase
MPRSRCRWTSRNWPGASAACACATPTTCARSRASRPRRRSRACCCRSGARKAGATVIHAPITFAPGYGELGNPDNVYGILKGVIDSKAFVKGTWGAEICDEMAPQGDDIVVEGKRGLDTFATTNLDFILRSRDIETVILGGFLTNCCVESTMRTAYEKGYDVITLTDCTAATSAEEQQSATAQDWPMFSQPMTSDQVVGALQGSPDVVKA